MEGDVQFDEDDSLDYVRPVRKQKKKSAMSLANKVVMSSGFAKDEKEAQRFLLGMAILLLIASGVFLYIGNTPRATPMTLEQSRIILKVNPSP